MTDKESKNNEELVEEFDLDDDSFNEILAEIESSEDFSSDEIEEEEEELTMPPPRKRYYRKKEVKKEDDTPRDENGLPEYKGTAEIPELTKQQKRGMNQALFQGTQNKLDQGPVTEGQTGPLPRKQTRVLPQTEPKNDHLLVKDIKLSKDMQTGNWIISEVHTNKGDFAMGPRQNERVNQAMIRNLVLYLKHVFEDDLKAYLDQ